MHPYDVGAAHGCGDRVPSGVTGFGLNSRTMVVRCGAVVTIRECRTLVLVRGRPVMMGRMIVADVFVHVQ